MTISFIASFSFPSVSCNYFDFGGIIENTKELGRNMISSKNSSDFPDITFAFLKDEFQNLKSGSIPPEGLKFTLQDNKYHGDYYVASLTFFEQIKVDGSGYKSIEITSISERFNDERYSKYAHIAFKKSDKVQRFSVPCQDKSVSNGLSTYCYKSGLYYEIILEKTIGEKNKIIEENNQEIYKNQILLSEYNKKIIFQKSALEKSNTEIGYDNKKLEESLEIIKKSENNEENNKKIETFTDKISVNKSKILENNTKIEELKKEYTEYNKVIEEKNKKIKEINNKIREEQEKEEHKKTARNEKIGLLLLRNNIKAREKIVGFTEIQTNPQQYYK